LHAFDKTPLIDLRLGIDYFLNLLPILSAVDLNRFSLDTQFFRDLKQISLVWFDNVLLVRERQFQTEAT
jgi:hypothetical protein